MYTHFTYIYIYSLYTWPVLAGILSLQKAEERALELLCLNFGAINHWLAGNCKGKLATVTFLAKGKLSCGNKIIFCRKRQKRDETNNFHCLSVKCLTVWQAVKRLKLTVGLQADIGEISNGVKHVMHALNKS